MRVRGHSKRCFDAFAALVGGLSLGVIAVQALAVEKDLTNKGEVLVKENCSRCHAIGKEGNSPHPEAPPFRTLSSRYPVEDLSESLAEGIVSGHPDMPIFDDRFYVGRVEPGKAVAESSSAVANPRRPLATSANRARPPSRRARNARRRSA